jgi:ankyrin repeat protein
MFFGLFDFAGRRNRKLRQAAKQGDRFTVRELLAKGADPNERDPDGGDTALVLACFGNHHGAVEAMLLGKADPNRQDRAGNTPLLAAAINGDAAFDVVQSLLTAGAKPDLCPDSGEHAGATALYAASTRGAHRLMQKLREAGASTTVSISDGLGLMHAIAMGGTGETVAMLGQWGLSVHTQSAGGITPLIYASIGGNVSVVRGLLEAGAGLEVADSEQRTPLMAAALNNRPDVVRELLSRGANPNARAITEDEPMTALRGAVIGGYDEVVRLLLEAGAPIDEEPRRKHSLVAMARGAGHESTAKLLESHKRKLKRQAAAKAKETEGESDQTGAAEAGQRAPASTPSPRKRNTAVELGVTSTGIRYDEHEHGKQLSKIFSKARTEWVKSKNDAASPHYAKACKLLSDWFTVEYRVRMGFSMSFGLNDDNEINRVAEVGAVKDSSEAADRAFADEPLLKSFEVVSVDFRVQTTHHPLQDKEKLGFSPEIGAVAVYQVKPGKKLGSAQALQEFLGTAGSMLTSCFSVQIKDEAIQTVEVDEDGDEYTSVSSSYSGGDVELEVNVTAAKDFKERLTVKVREANKSPALLGEATPEPKRVLMLGDEERLQRLLDEGLPVDTRVNDETLLKLALMLAATANSWYENEELSASLKSRFSTADDYLAAIKRMVLDLLDRDADVNVAGGSMSVLALAEVLNDSDILTICRARATSVDDPNSTALLLAAERGDVASLAELLDRGARINKRFLQTGVTPLMMASQGPDGEDAPALSGEQLARHEAAVRLLIERGARLDARSDRGDTAIGNAVRRGNVSIVQILLDAGAKTKDALPKGQDLMDLARERGHKPVVEVLRRAAGRRQSKPPEDAADQIAQTAALAEEKANSLGQELLAAALAGQHEKAGSLLRKGANPLAANEKGIPAFLAPVLTDNLQMQRIFLQSGVSPGLATDPGGVTALMVAAARGSKDICNVLLDAGADINQLLASGEPFFSHPKGIDFDMPALGCAVDAQQWDLAAHLLSRGAKPEFGVMHTDIALTLAKFAPVSLVEEMHQAGYCIVMDHEFMMLFAPPLEMQLPQMRSKVVFWAAANPDPDVLPWVLAHGGDPMAGNSLGMTPLMVAAAVGNTPLVEELLSEGADPAAQDCDGDTALSLAVERGHKAAVAALRRHMASVDPADLPVLTLHQAAARGDLWAVLDRLDQGVSPNLRDEEGCTAFMRAAQAGQVAALRILFAMGGSVRPRNAQGKSAWDLGQEASDKRIRVSLKEFNADDPKRTDDDERFDAWERVRGRYANPFKYPGRLP